MLPFPSEAWCQALIAAINEDPETRLASDGWEGDFAAAIVDVPGLPERDFVVFCRPERGRVGGFRRLAGAWEMEELAPAYEARATYETWKALLTGRLDPFAAILARKLRFAGNLEPIIARARFREILRRAAAKVSTDFAA